MNINTEYRPGRFEISLNSDQHQVARLQVDYSTRFPHIKLPQLTVEVAQKNLLSNVPISTLVGIVSGIYFAMQGDPLTAALLSISLISAHTLVRVSGKIIENQFIRAPRNQISQYVDQLPTLSAKFDALRNVTKPDSDQGRLLRKQHFWFNQGNYTEAFPLSEEYPEDLIWNMHGGRLSIKMRYHLIGNGAAIAEADALNTLDFFDKIDDNIFVFTHIQHHIFVPFDIDFIQDFLDGQIVTFPGTNVQIRRPTPEEVEAAQALNNPPEEAGDGEEEQLLAPA